MKNKVLLFAFRNSHTKFFEKLKKLDTKNEFDIIRTRDKFFFNISGLRYINKVDFSKACNFAVDEFYAKTDLKVPRFLLQLFFKTFSYFNYFRYFNILQNEYTKLLIWNGGKFRQRIAIEIAKVLDIEVYYFENGLLPNRLVFDSQGINFDNSVPRDIEFFKNYNLSLSLPDNIIQRRGKREKRFSVEKTPLPKKYIFVPFQVDYDTQIITNSPWVKNMRQLFNIIENISKKINYHFILKEHPSSGKTYNDLHQRAKSLNNVSFENGYLTEELIKNSIAVITINSTVGVESLLFHKKVITLGNAFYQIDSISLKARDENQLIKLITKIEDIIIDFYLVDNFLKYLYYDYLISKDEKILYKEFYRRLSNESHLI